MPEFDLVAEFFAEYGATVLTDGEQDVVRSWCVSALPATGSPDDTYFRACTVNAGRMEVAYLQFRDDGEGRWLLGCIYVRRTHFLKSVGHSVPVLRELYDALDFDPDVRFKAARLGGSQDALRIYFDLTDPESVAQLENLPWRESARVLVDHLRCGALMPKWSDAHSRDLANLLTGQITTSSSEL
ncbi:hypothetical protein [Gordonia tangerina]|uniref:Uncharacterized protein n=1 Tax=Gordonia tangerina TaxID=2911060 RepID=A0ABS9DLW1_9ACTN|nr:hypothetical protein [Gordonia tangerina]MCF3939562.1 hypothetical protein [Gordonia tangerina]